jgi:acetyl esterase/lipase
MTKNEPASYKQPLTYKISYGTDKSQYGKLYLPGGPGPYPVVILIHGGFWRKPYDLTLMRPLAHDLVRRGIAIWNIEYRRIGNEGGAWPGTLLDVAAAADHLLIAAPIHDLDLQRVIAIGHSAGGHLACWLAARHRLPEGAHLKTINDPLALRGVVSLAGVVDLIHGWRLHLSNNAVRELLGRSPMSLPERYQEASPAELLPLGIPQILVHGTADETVPLIISQDYTQKARAAGDQITLLEVPEATHFDVIDPASAAWQQTLVAMQQVMHIPSAR